MLLVPRFTADWQSVGLYENLIQTDEECTNLYESVYVCRRQFTPFKKGENKKNIKKYWHFYRFSEFARPVTALLSPRLMLLSSGQTQELVASENSRKLFLSGRQQTVDTYNPRLESLFLFYLYQWVSVSVFVGRTVFLLYYFCYGGIMDFVHS